MCRKEDRVVVKSEPKILHGCSWGSWVNNDDVPFLTIQFEIVFLHPNFSVSETVD